MPHNGMLLSPEQHHVIRAVAEEFFLRQDRGGKGERMFAQIAARTNADRLVAEITSTLTEIVKTTTPEPATSRELDALRAVGR